MACIIIQSPNLAATNVKLSQNTLNMELTLPQMIGGNEDGFLVRRGSPIDETTRWESGHGHCRGIRPIRSSAIEDALASCFDQQRVLFESVTPHATFICPVRIGFNNVADADSEITLFFCVKPDCITKLEALELLKVIAGILQSYDEILNQVAIEIAEKTFEAAGLTLDDLVINRSDAQGIRLDDTYVDNPQPGVSIGPANGLVRGAGSSGPILQIVFDDGLPKHFVLTCHHVISERASQTTNTSGIAIYSPSNDDHAHWYDTLDYVSKEYSVEAYAPQLKRVSEFDRKFGTVVCSSGLGQVVKGYHMDWALISLEPCRFPNIGSLTSAPITISDRVEYASKGVNLNINRTEGQDSTPLANLPKSVDSIVIARGRTSGRTVGRLHRVEASVRIGFNILKEDGKTETISPFAKSLVVGGKRTTLKPKWFATRGDSGALALDTNGHAIGMVIGCDDKWGQVPHFASFVTPMEEILKDIRRKLEGEGNVIKDIRLR